MSIYFISDGENVKVGYSNDPEKKVSDLQTGNPKKLVLLHTIDGNLKDEQKLHADMKDHRLAGEWFSVENNHKLQSLIPNFNITKNSMIRTVSNNIEQKKIDKLDSLSAWQAASVKKQYGNAFDGLTKPVLNPQESTRTIEIPIYGTPPPVTVGQVLGIREQQNHAQFLLPSDFCDSMLTDHRIYGLLQVRINSLIGAGIELKPADESDKAKEIQEDCDKLYTTMLPTSEVGELLRWGLLLGNGLCKIDWDTRKGKWIPILSIFHPRYMYYNWATKVFMLSTQSNGQMEILPDDIQWGIFTPYTNHLPWLKGLVKPISMSFIMRQILEQWWMRAEERNGMPIVGAVTSAEATPEEERLFISQLQNLSNNSTVRLPQGVDGNKFDLKLIQSDPMMHQGFKQFLEYLDKELAITILGQSKTTSSQSSGVSFGGENAGETVRTDLMRFDANAISEFLREKVLKPYVKFNYGEQYQDLAPYISYDIEEPEDLGIKAVMFKDLMTGLETAGKVGLSNMVDIRALLEKFELPLNEESKAPNDLPNLQNSGLEPQDDLNNTEKLSSYADLKKMLGDSNE